jgi:hypothetical protein
MKYFRFLFIILITICFNLPLELPANAQSTFPATILNITPIPDACVLRNSPDPLRRQLFISGTGFPSPRTTHNVQFRRADGGGESNYIGMEVTWSSSTQISIRDIATISQFLWPSNNRLTLEVRLTYDNGGSQAGYSDWSTARFILAQDATACSQLPTITSISPAIPGCVLRTGTNTQTTLIINGRGFPTARVTENLRFRQQDDGISAVSNPLGMQITWTSGSQIAVNIATISQFIWPQNSRVRLQAQLTAPDIRRPGLQFAISDWSPPFIVAQDSVACGAQLNYYQVTQTGFPSQQTLLTGVQTTANAFRRKLGSPDLSDADAFKRVMFATGRNEIRLTWSGTGAGCQTDNNVALPLQATITCGTSTNMTEYTLVHELGHVLVGRTGGHAAGFFVDLNAASVSDSIGVVFGRRKVNNVDDWTRGQRGWGSAGAPLPNPCNFQQDPYTNNASSIDEKEIDETAADMFLNWVYKKVARGGFQNIDWSGITNCSGTGTTAGQPGDVRNNWMESELDRLRGSYWP